VTDHPTPNRSSLSAVGRSEVIRLNGLEQPSGRITDDDGASQDLSTSYPECLRRKFLEPSSG